MFRANTFDDQGTIGVPARWSARMFEMRPCPMLGETSAPFILLNDLFIAPSGFAVANEGDEPAGRSTSQARRVSRKRAFRAYQGHLFGRSRRPLLLAATRGVLAQPGRTYRSRYCTSALAVTGFALLKKSRREIDHRGENSGVETEGHQSVQRPKPPHLSRSDGDVRGLCGGAEHERKVQEIQ